MDNVMDNVDVANAQRDLAVSILPIIAKCEEVDPELAKPGWFMLFDIIRMRLGDDRFYRLLREFFAEKKVDKTLSGYVNLKHEILLGHKGETHKGKQ